MSVLVGALNKFIPRSPFKSDGEVGEVKDTGSEPGTSGDGCVSSPREKLLRQLSKSSFYESEEDDRDEVNTSEELVLGPLISLKDQLDKDKEDESLRRWKEQLLGSVHVDSIEEGVEPEVKVLSLSILSAGRPDIIIPFPLANNTRHHLFTLKEGTAYNFKFTFLVRRNIVSGLTFIHTVWKNGLRVAAENSRVMLGTFSPQLDPYTYIMEEETTPSGLLTRGSYTARIKFIDDDCRRHLEIEHTFGIKKDW